MKTFILSSALVLLWSPFIAYAVEPVDATTKSIFKNRSQITFTPISVPRVVEFDAPFSVMSPQIHAIVDTASQEPVPSIIIEERTATQTRFHVTGSDNIRFPQALADHDTATYAEFIFSERTDKNGYVIPDEATFEITADRPITTSGFSLLLGAHTGPPQSVRVSVIENGQERLLLPYKDAYTATVRFPEITSSHFRISVKYTDVLRIHEIIFAQKSVPITQSRRIRFLAQPGAAYEIYFNADRHVTIDTGEKPRLGEEKHPLLGTVIPEDNPAYHQADTDGDGIIDDQDNCPLIANKDQTDKNQNHKGDACEDFDHDGVLGGRDNCPYTPNHNQHDQDADGIGDACDQQEDRFLERYPWLPSATIIFVGLFVAFLIAMTLKKK